MNLLIVGAGFSGAVYARKAAEDGHRVHVIDRRDHLAGNACDFECEGSWVHRYGPHFFHTSNVRVVEWLSRFTEWVPYEHRVKALLDDGRLVPFPLNRETVRAVLGDDHRLLERDTSSSTSDTPISAKAYLVGKIGEELTELFFERYTKKMWGLSLSDLSADVVRRVKVRDDDEDRYFPSDAFQALPKHGYTRLFENILDHPRIRLTLSEPFERSMEKQHDFVFNAMAVDEYFDQQLGRLLYRSLKFHHRNARRDESRGAVTINYTGDPEASPYTRRTHWHRLPTSRPREGTYPVTEEKPCADHENNFERYYPVKTPDGRYEKLYRRYVDLAKASSSKTKFIGRCGTYRYLDMDQVVSQSLHGYAVWKRENGTSSGSGGSCSLVMTALRHFPAPVPRGPS